MSEDKKMTRDEAFDALEEMGAVKANVRFSGGHDEGGADYIEIQLGDGEIKTLNEYVWQDGPKQTDEETALAVALAAPVYGEFGGFAGDFSVCGDVLWTVTSREIFMSGEEQDWHPFEERQI